MINSFNIYIIWVLVSMLKPMNESMNEKIKFEIFFFKILSDTLYGSRVRIFYRLGTMIFEYLIFFTLCVD